MAHDRRFLVCRAQHTRCDRLCRPWNRPTPLEESEVKAILKQMEEEAPKVRVSYQVGQAVKITDGPFTDFEGVVDAIDQEEGKVRVLVSFFGRETPVELDFLQVTRLID